MHRTNAISWDFNSAVSASALRVRISPFTLKSPNSEIGNLRNSTFEIPISMFSNFGVPRSPKFALSEFWSSEICSVKVLITVKNNVKLLLLGLLELSQTAEELV